MNAETGPGSERRHTVIDSPVGQLTLVASGRALVGAYMGEQRHRPPATALGERAHPYGVLAEAIDQLAEYFAGTRTRFDIPLAVSGTPFQTQVWAALRTIPYARTASYAELAGRIGHPNACRAVGLANGRNPVSIVIPCHRVIGAGGELTGYGGGLDRKRRLLGLEQARAPDLFGGPAPGR